MICSIPLSRGQVCRGHNDKLMTDLTTIRFIPACAGNILRATGYRAAQTVHPRVCGEHIWNASITTGFFGSSPRVRGTLLGAIGLLGRRRFIPACAGNMSRSQSRCLRTPVHPRVCGEHPYGLEYKPRTVGSSPRVRGTSFDRSMNVSVLRFIPACAGNILPKRK